MIFIVILLYIEQLYTGQHFVIFFLVTKTSRSQILKNVFLSNQLTIKIKL
jgi:hypothetical protein